MRLPKFLQRLKPKNWSRRVDYWPAEYPHHITTYADVAAMQHIMSSSGVLNTVAIDSLLKGEDFWWALSNFFQDEIAKLGEIELVFSLQRPSTAIRKVPLYCWGIEDE